MGSPRNRVRQRGGRHKDGWEGGERWTALYAIGGWVDVSGNCRADFILEKLLILRGLSLDSSAFIQWFRRLITATRETFAGAECEIHLDNARTRLYSADFRPTDATRRKAALMAKAISILEGGDDTP